MKLDWRLTASSRNDNVISVVNGTAVSAMVVIYKQQRPVAEDILQDKDIALIEAVAEMVAAQDEETVEQMAVVESF